MLASPTNHYKEISGWMESTPKLGAYSHINSYNRKKLNNQSAHQLFSFINGGDILDKLGIKSIPANEINLTPLLLKK